ncbi:glutamic acid-rich protein-like [Papaver somniferum]|uniref:glutamic acid-rich protein-like n=1 Tax=Papaver somniferum TaxID=3469 RepID=UPI000E6FD995|nr:glutamic acid-rich protein-like [Papaver somniferum]
MSSFHAFSDFVNRNLEEDEAKRGEKVWFTNYQLEKQKEGPFWPVVDIFVHKNADRKDEKHTSKKRDDIWTKNPNSILKIVRQYRHEICDSGGHYFMFDTTKKNKQVAVKSEPEDLFLFYGIKMVPMEVEKGEDVKTAAENKYGPLINRLTLKKRTELGKKDVEKEIANGSMISKNHFAHFFESLDRMKRTCWPVHIHEYLMESIKKHQDSPLKVNGCVLYLLAYNDEERFLLDEYRRKKQENIIDVVKEKLRISDMRRKELDEELSEVLDGQERLLSFVEEKRLKVNEEEEDEDDGEEHKEDDEIEEDEDEEDDKVE